MTSQGKTIVRARAVQISVHSKICTGIYNCSCRQACRLTCTDAGLLAGSIDCNSKFPLSFRSTKLRPNSVTISEISPKFPHLYASTCDPYCLGVDACRRTFPEPLGEIHYLMSYVSSCMRCCSWIHSPSCVFSIFLMLSGDDRNVMR